MSRGRSNNFNGVAKFYDPLVKRIFGKSMFDAQTFYLKDIPLGAKVLILGGGTGWLLSELMKINPACSIWYIESSSEMLSKSRLRAQVSKQLIYFIEGTESSIPSDIQYDFAITNFFLDLFREKKADVIIKKIKYSMHGESQWIVTDFENLTWWHAAMLKAMYIFFKLTSKIEASELPALDSLFAKNGMAVRKSKSFYGRFIRTALFQRIPQE